jgi:hypothetical protein
LEGNEELRLGAGAAVVTSNARKAGSFRCTDALIHPTAGAAPRSGTQHARGTLRALPRSSSRRRTAMADDKTKRGKPDRSKINMNEDYEVKYWAKELGVTRAELQRVIDKVGNAAAAVRKELGS